MIVFEILMTAIVFALVIGQARRVQTCVVAESAGWRKPANRNDEPRRFWLLFAFEVFLLIAVASFFYSILGVWFE